MLEPTAAAALPTDVDAVAVPVHDDLRAPDGAGPAPGPELLRRCGFEGKPGQAVILPGEDGRALVAVGVGAPGGFDAGSARAAGAALAGQCSHLRSVATTVLAAGPSAGGAAAPGLASALVEGALLAAYRYPGARRKPPVHDLEHLVVVGADQAELARGTVSARATSRARDWVNEPAGSMNPTRLAQVATELGAASGFAVEVWDEQRIAAERLGGILGVSAGSATPPRLVRLAYEPAGAVATVALVGKGITFDSGGLSLKPHEGMLTMKGDMGGAAAVLASVAAAAELGLPVRALGFLALAENMPSGSATRLGDVLIARNGTSIEVLNTDAEGRLVLADALSLAVEERPDAIVDVATLTGAKVIALGNDVTGVMGTSPDLVARVLAAGRAAGEPAWELPLVQEYRAQLDSEVADLRNVGTGRAAGSIMAGLFLREFVSDVPWAHLDIAGCEMAERSEGWLTKGGTGWAARTLVELLRAW